MTSYEIRQIARAVINLFRDEIEEMISPILESAFRNLSRDRILDAGEVGKLIGKSRKAVIRRCQRGQLPYHQNQAGEYFFSEKELYDFLIVNGRTRMLDKSTEDLL